MALKYVSNSELSSFGACRFQWYWTYVRRLKPKIAAPPLRFGTLIHKGLQEYYKPGRVRGPNPVLTFEREYERELKEQVRMGFKDEDGTWHDAAELGADMLKSYLGHWGDDDEYEVIATEQKFETPIKDESGKLMGVYVGVLDMIWRHLPTGVLEVVDHKAVKTIDTKFLRLDTQSGNYWTFGSPWLISKGLISSANELGTICFNFLRKALKDKRKYKINKRGEKVYLNADGTPSKKQPAEFFVRQPDPRSNRQREVREQMVRAQLHELKLARDGELEIYKTPSKFVCMFCPVRDICEIHEHGGDFEELARMTMVAKGEWTPVEYKDEAYEAELEH